MIKKISILSLSLSIFIAVSACKTKGEKVNTSKETDTNQTKLNEKENEIAPIFLFDEVAQPPLYPGSKQTTTDGQRMHFEKELNMFIKNGLDANEQLAAQIPTGVYEVPVTFEIDTQGGIRNIEAQSKYDELNTAIRNILNDFPQVQPARQNGEPAEVSVNKIITYFVGQKTKKKEVDIVVDGITIAADIPENMTMHMTDKAPVFPGCEGQSGVPLIKCTSSKINTYIATNINTENLKGNNLPKGKHRLEINFTITEQGGIADASVQNPHDILRQEVMRVISTMPKMQPAYFETVKVPVKYNVVLTTTIN
jgi:hypothetical protein